MSDLRVVRWRRFGHDRLYVSRPDGTTLGWWDLLLDEPCPAAPELLEPLGDAVRWWRHEQRAEAPMPDVPTPDVPTPDVPATVSASVGEAPVPAAAATPTADVGAPRVDPDEWTDVAAARAGAAARARAAAEREAAPIRTAVARVLRVHTDERAWRIGADGEEMVAARLERLARRDPRWRFLHAVPVGDRGSDIDHVAIGPAGVFTLNTKHHPGKKVWVGGNTIMVGGHRVPYVRNSRHEAARASRLLSAATGGDVPVLPLIVIVGATDVVVKRQPADVTVVMRRRLDRWLAKQPTLLSDREVADAFDAARRSTTWT